MIIEYHMNNSGGNEWLTQEQWKALESAGWKLGAYENFVYEQGDHKRDEGGLPITEGEVADPRYAFKKFATLDVAIEEWERVTGESSYDTGCETCGDPHNFSVAYEEDL